MGLDMDFSKLQPQDILDLAVFAEEEAYEQYEFLAGAMERHGKRDVADFFRKMAAREERHRQQISERRAALYPGAVANLANRTLWGIEAPYKIVPAETMTAAQAFAIAMAAEKKAEAYYAAAMEQAIPDEVTQLFETLRQAEVEHQRMLELERGKTTP